MTTRAQRGLGPLLGTSRKPPRRFRRAAGVLSPSLVPSPTIHPDKNPAAHTPVASAHDRCLALSKTIRMQEVATSTAVYPVCMSNKWGMHKTGVDVHAQTWGKCPGCWLDQQVESLRSHHRNAAPRSTGVPGEDRRKFWASGVNQFSPKAAPCKEHLPWQPSGQGVPWKLHLAFRV